MPVYFISCYHERGHKLKEVMLWLRHQTGNSQNVWMTSSARTLSDKYKKHLSLLVYVNKVPKIHNLKQKYYELFNFSEISFSSCSAIDNPFLTHMINVAKTANIAQAMTSGVIQTRPWLYR